MFRRKKNAPILKTPGEIDAMRHAGYVSALVLEELAGLIMPGVSTLELDAAAQRVIEREGGRPAFKGYGGFPATICASINDVIVHGIPSADAVLEDGDIVSIDTGAIVDGWVGDNARTYLVGTVGEDKRRLCEATEEAMWAGVKAACPGGKLGDIGSAVQSVAHANGIGVVREYGGHGIGKHMHEPPHVANHGRRNTGMVLESGLVIAIEPLFTLGSPKTKVRADGWAVATRDGRSAAHYERTVAVTEEGPVVLTTTKRERHAG